MNKIVDAIKYSLGTPIDNIWPLVAYPIKISLYHSIRFSVGVGIMNSLEDSVAITLKTKI